MRTREQVRTSSPSILLATFVVLALSLLALPGGASAQGFTEGPDYVFNYQPTNTGPIRLDWNLFGGAENLDYYIHADVIASGHESAVRGAFQTIEDDPASAVSFTYRGSTAVSSEIVLNGNQWQQPSDGLNVVSFNPLPSQIIGRGGFQGSFGVNAAGQPTGNGVGHFDLSLSNSALYANGAVPGRVDMESLVLHELGHAIGLDHPTANSASAMWSVLPTNAIKRSLHPADSFALSQLYPAPEDPSALQFTNPAHLGQLPCGGGIRLNWTPPTGGAAGWTFAVHAGSSPGGSDLGAAGSSTTSTWFGNLPTDGSLIHFRLFAKPPGGSFTPVRNASMFSCNGSPARFTQPASSALACGTVAVAWSSPTNAGPGWSYAVWAGASLGGAHYGKAGSTSTSTFLASLPDSGETVHLRLFARPPGGVFAPIDDIVRTACQVAPPQFTSPAPGTTLPCGGGIRFNWAAPSDGGNGWTYAVHAGSTPGGSDIGAAGSTSLSTWFGNIPTDGSNVHLRLFARPPGGSFTAVQDASYPSCNGNPPAFNTVGPSCSSSKTVSWSSPSFVQPGWAYAVWAGAGPGARHYGAAGSTTLSTTLSGLPTGGQTIRLTLFARPPGGVFVPLDSATYRNC